MQIFKLKTGQHRFSKNPIIFKYAIYPFSDYMSNANLYAIIKIDVEDVFGSDQWKTIKTTKLYPSAEGIVEIDVASIIDAHLSYFIPPVNLDKIVEATEQFKSFRIFASIYQADGSAIDIGLDGNPVTITAIKGGFSYEYPIPNNYYYPSSNNPLRPALFFSDTKERVFKEDTFFIYYIPPPSSNADYCYAKCTVTYLKADKTIGTSVIDIGSDVTPINGDNSIHLLPAGYNQLSLDEALPEGATPISYTISVFAGYNGSGSEEPFQVILPITFELDQRNFYNTYQLLYRNSLGGLQPLRLTGAIDQSSDYSADNVQLVKQLYSIKEKNIAEQEIRLWVEEQQKFTANTGWLSRFEAERMRDFFLSTQIFQVKDNRLVPVIINKSTVKFYSNNDTLFNIEFDFQQAFVNSSWSPPILLSDTIPDIDLLNWKQSANNQITVYWSLPIGYNDIRVKIKFVTDSSEQTFDVEGNSGLKKINFTRPDWATADTNIIVSAKIIANKYNETPSFGPEMILSAANLLASFSVIAFDDYYTLPKGFNSAATIANPLNNDVDPDGGDIEAVANSGSTAQGGSFTIDSAGNTTYTPPSSAFVGKDSFTYQVKKTGSSDTVTATYHITVFEI